MASPADFAISDLRATLDKARQMVENRVSLRPRIGIVLGSGLGAIGSRLEHRIPYTEVPGMPRSTVPGHQGYLCLGSIEGATVACLQGRSHLYEGHDPSTVVFGVRLLGTLGCNAVLLTNAAGGIARALSPGAFMLLNDHLNLTGNSPLVGPNDDAFGPRFPDMSHVYDEGLRAAAHRAARQANVALKEGVYAGLLGPSYETPAEIRMLRTLGADAVGMSTVLEAIALRHMGVRVAGVSSITNFAAGIGDKPLRHDEVEAVAKEKSSAFVALVSAFVTEVDRELCT